MRQESILKFTETLLRIIVRVGVFMIAILIIRAVTKPTAINPIVKFEIEKGGEVVKDKTYPFEISTASGKVKYPEEFTPRISTMIVHHGTDIGGVILKTFILYQLLLIVKNKRISSTAFNNENSKRLRSIGYTIFLLGILSVIQPIYDQYFFEGSLFLTPVSTPTSYAYKTGYFIGGLSRVFLSNYTLSGLFALILSYVLQEGITLKEETELTI